MGSPDYDKGFKNNGRVISQLQIISSFLLILMPEYKLIIENEKHVLLTKYVSSPHFNDINSFLEHMKDLLQISFIGEESIESGNVFLGIEEKIKRAEKSAKEGNIEGLFSNLHTIIELLLKDKLGIALDMDGARLGKVIKICIENNIFKEKNSILKSLNINVCEIDNKIKHSGYNPTPKQINDALLITTQAIRVLKKEIPELSNEIIDEISKILIKTQ